MNSRITPCLITDRLNLRQFLAQDLESLYLLHSNPEVAKTTIDGVQTLEAVKKHLENFISHQENHGYSQWAVFEKSSNKFVGRAGLTKRILNKEIGEQVEIRFAFLPEFWGLGYASEISKALVRFGFNDLKLEILVAATGLYNEKSTKILLKNGFKYIKNIIPEGYAVKDEIKYYILENYKFYENSI